MNYIIFDLEATCFERKMKRFDMFRMETIEIGAVKYNDSFQYVDSFDAFIKPVINPILSDFCKNLTNIKQEDVDGARLFSEVIKDFKVWVGEVYILASWGFYDKLQLQLDCTTNNLKTSWVDKHISLKHQYMKMKNLKKCGLIKALELEGLIFEGVQHNALVDAINTTKIFIKYFNDWVY